MVLSGCAVTSPTADETADPGASADATSSAAIPAEPIESVDPTGMWRVSQAKGAIAETWLYLGGHVAVWTRCGTTEGEWNTRGNQFVAALFMSTRRTCDSNDFSTDAPWLYEATGVRPSGEGFDLVDGDGETVAHLSADGSPPSETRAEYRYAPVSDRTEPEFNSLPADALVATDIVGEWIDPEHSDDNTFIEFRDDGSWAGSDGCNRTGGRWVLGEAGLLVVASGIRTLIGCDGSDVAELASVATGVAATSTGLTFYGPDGVLVSVVAK